MASVERQTTHVASGVSSSDAGSTPAISTAAPAQPAQGPSHSRRACRRRAKEHSHGCPIRFTKASGAGNDFVVIDATRGASLPGYAALARAACDRHAGVGADGLIVLEAEPSADFRMRYYNRTAHRRRMCGNGGRLRRRFRARQRHR